MRLCKGSVLSISALFMVETLGIAQAVQPSWLGWFEALNPDFRYQLTVTGQFAQAIVPAEIANRSLIIKTSKPA